MKKKYHFIFYLIKYNIVLIKNLWKKLEKVLKKINQKKMMNMIT